MLLLFINTWLPDSFVLGFRNQMWFFQLFFLNDFLKAVLYKTGRRENTFLVSLFGLVDGSYITPNANCSDTSGSIHEGILL